MFDGLKPNVNKCHIKAALRRFIGFPAMPAHDVADLTGIPLGTVQGHIAPEGPLPNLAHFLLYANLFGVLFSNTMLGMVDQGGALELKAIFINPFERLAESAELVSLQAGFLSDRRYDYRERLILMPRALEEGIKQFQFHRALRDDTFRKAA